MHVHIRLLVCILEISKRLFCNLVSIFSCRTHVAKMSPSDKILKMIVQKFHSYQKLKIIYNLVFFFFFFFFFFSSNNANFGLIYMYANSFEFCGRYLLQNKA